MIVDTNGIAEGCNGYRRARFSSDRTHRYTLEEYLRDTYASDERACFLLCNPSTADALTLDNTVSRCRTWSMRWGYNSYEVVNLFSFRTTYPSVLKEVGEKAGQEFRQPRDRELPSDWREAREQAIRFAMGSDPINDAEILAACSRASLIVCAWGEIEIARKRGEAMRSVLAPRFALHHLGLTKYGYPKHPVARGRAAILTTQEPIKWA